MSNLPPKKPKLEQDGEISEDADSEHLNSAPDENTKIVFGELLRKILNGLSSSDLLENARLVSKGWRDDATWILRQRLDSFGATFKFHPGKNTFISFKSSHVNLKEEKEVEENLEEKELSKLTELFKAVPSHNFPSTHFRFQGGSLDCPQVLHFFSAFGENILKLTVDVWKNPLTKDGALRQKIFPMAPQFKSLELMDSDQVASWTETQWALRGAHTPEVNLGHGQGQDRGRGQLKTLLFSTSVSQYQRIQRLLRQIEPELAQHCFISIASLGFNTFVNRDLDLGPDLFNRRVITEVNQVKLDVFNANTVRLLEQFTHCRFKFKDLSIDSSGREPVSQNELIGTGKALGKILDFTRETLETADFSAESFLLLTRQPFFPGFFPNLKSIQLNFCLTSSHQQVNPNFSVDLILPRSNSDPNSGPDPDPPLWKNLSEVMPSLKSVWLSLFDVNCEPWLPFFDLNAGPNPTVKQLNLNQVSRRETIQKLSRTFPSLQILGIDTSLIPPPSAVDSWQNVVRWLFSVTDKDEKKRRGKGNEKQIDGRRRWENRTEKTEIAESIPGPISNLKFLKSLYLRFKSCSSLDSTPGDTPNASMSRSRIQNSKTLGGCFLSKVSGGKFLLLNEDSTLWRESLSAPNHNQDPPEFSKFLYLGISCSEHRNASSF